MPVFTPGTICLQAIDIDLYTISHDDRTPLRMKDTVSRNIYLTISTKIYLILQDQDGGDMADYGNFLEINTENFTNAKFRWVLCEMSFTEAELPSFWEKNRALADR